MFDMSKIGAQIRDLRKLRNETQRETAGACNLSQSYMALLENGERTPLIDVLDRIATHLGGELVISIQRARGVARTPEQVEDEKFVDAVAAIASRVRDPVERKVFLRDLERAAEREAERHKQSG